MSIRSRLMVLLMVLCPILPGFGRTPAKERAEGVSSETASSLQQSSLQEIASTAVLPGATGQTEVSKTKQAVPKDLVILRGSALGAVKFDHKLHSLARNTRCETCHHPSRREKPAAAQQQACTECHTKVAIAPMKTKRQAAFHNATATSGTCIDCHKAENAHGKLTPLKCLGCHKKENEVVGG